MSGEIILVVEDKASNMKLIRAILMHEGYNVYEAEDVEQAQAKLAKIHPNLILMDIQLPGMDGLTFTRILKANPNTRDILIVALTAYAMKGDQQMAFDAGCDAYITKPIDRVSFLNDVRRYLDMVTTSHRAQGQTVPSQMNSADFLA